MPVQYAYGAVAFKDYLTVLKQRLLSVLTLAPIDTGDDPVAVDDTYVRVVIEKMMNEAGTEYRAEQGVTIRVGEVRPDANSGAGRNGWKVKRLVEIFVVTGPSLLDRAGDATLALANHLTVEEQVIDAVVDNPPSGEPNNLALHVRCTWVEGGKRPKRQDETDFGLIQSSLLMLCEYPAKLTTNRD